MPIQPQIFTPRLPQGRTAPQIFRTEQDGFAGLAEAAAGVNRGIEQGRQIKRQNEQDALAAEIARSTAGHRQATEARAGRTEQRAERTAATSQAAARTKAFGTIYRALADGYATPDEEGNIDPDWQKKALGDATKKVNEMFPDKEKAAGKEKPLDAPSRPIPKQPDQPNRAAFGLPESTKWKLGDTRTVQGKTFKMTQDNVWQLQ